MNVYIFKLSKRTISSSECDSILWQMNIFIYFSSFNFRLKINSSRNCSSLFRFDSIKQFDDIDSGFNSDLDQRWLITNRSIWLLIELILGSIDILSVIVPLSRISPRKDRNRRYLSLVWRWRNFDNDVELQFPSTVPGISIPTIIKN